MAASFLLHRVSYYNFSSLILFESMYLCRRIISGCTAIVDDDFFLFCCKRSCMSHCLCYHHSLPFILEERMILYLFVGIVTAILLITLFFPFSLSSSEDPHFEPDFYLFFSSHHLHSHHYVLDESMTSLTLSIA